MPTTVLTAAVAKPPRLSHQGLTPLPQRTRDTPGAPGSGDQGRQHWVPTDACYIRPLPSTPAGADLIHTGSDDTKQEYVPNNKTRDTQSTA